MKRGVQKEEKRRYIGDRGKEKEKEKEIRKRGEEES